MNTAEIAIEQLFAGILAMLACLLPFFALEVAWCALGAGSSLAVGLLGAAYLLGAAFDRVFDGIVGGLEQWARLRFAKKRFDERQAPRPTGDPFPQRELERAIRGAEGGREWMSHLRTRLRLTRSVAVAAPLVALGAAYQRFTGTACGAGTEPLVTLSWSGALPVVVLLAVLGVATWLRPPKTHQVAYDDASVTDRLPKLDLDARWRDAVAPLAVLYGAPLVLVCFVAEAPAGTCAALLGGAYVVGALSLWSWWRLLEAYLSFVGSFEPRA